MSLWDLDSSLGHNKMSIPPELITDGEKGIVRSFRDVAPAHYIFKIQSFSSFSKNGIDKHESFEFEAGGYQWKLALHPNGNKSRKEKDHISLYLMIAQTSSLPPNWEINVVFRFFLYNHIQDKYLTVQGGLRRFRALKTESGFDQFIPLSILNDPDRGYLVDDTCAFGAEVFVIKSAGKGECLSMVKNATPHTFTWKIQNFSLIKNEEVYFSEVFIAGDYKWNLKLYPRGDYDWKDLTLSLYLMNIADSKSLTSDHQLYVKFRFRVVDQIHGKHVEPEAVDRWCSSSCTGWGWPNLLQLGDLNNPEKGFLLEDTCIIEAEVTVLGVVDKF